MLNRYCLGVLLLAGLAVSLTGCNVSSGLDFIAVTPTVDSLVVGGPTLQLTATGTFGNGSHPTNSDVTNSVTWSSAIPGVATVSSTGVVTAVSAGVTTITATAVGYSGPISSSVSVTVSGSGTGPGSTTSAVVSLAIIPAAQSVASPAQTSQFIAIGTTSTGATINLTSLATWSSSSIQIATVGSPEKVGTVAGLATAVSQGAVTITALYTNVAQQTVITGTAGFTVTGGGAASQSVTALTVIPSSQSLSQSGQTGQLIALATLGSSGLVEDVTNSPQLTWSSNIPTIATVSNYPAVPAGLVTGKSAGSVTITAEYTNLASGSTPANVVSATTTAAITTVSAPEPLLSLTIIPNTITVNNLQGTGQFLAIGTYATTPTVRDLTNSPNLVWLSSVPNVFPVNTNTGGSAGATAGIVTAYGSGGAVIIAEATNPADGTVQTATATFNCPLVLPPPPGSTSQTPGSCYPGSEASALLSTVTVYNQGLNTTNWLVTAPSATGTANVIHCGPGWAGAGGSVCVATYPIGTPITLTAPAGAGAFGGWSSNCTPNPATPTAAGPNQCILTPTTYDETVGAIFN